MSKLIDYVKEILDENIHPVVVERDHLGELPFYLVQHYRFYKVDLMGRTLLLVELVDDEEPSVLQLSKQKEFLEKTIDVTVVFILNNLPAYNRKRLIQKRVNFIVPGRQLYIPEMMMDLREVFTRNWAGLGKNKLIPSSQFLVLYHILRHDNHETIDSFSFKTLAEKTGYTQMAISKAVDNLKSNKLIEVQGTKEKRIHFTKERVDLWNTLERLSLWINPVIKQVFVDKLPYQAVLRSNISALAEYTEINPSRQKYYAIEGKAYYSLQRNNELNNANDHEGNYCLELWRYNPLRLTERLDGNKTTVDPLSLYLSLKGEKDERIEMALHQIIEKYIYGKGS